MKHAKQYFDSHSTVSKLYFTSDQLSFFDEQQALSHASQLADKSVIAMTRAEVDNEINQIINDNWDDLNLDESDPE